MKRFCLAAVLGGLVMFVWGALSHMVFGIAESAFTPMDAATEMAVLGALDGRLEKDGLYFAPWIDMGGDASDDETKAFTEKHENGPTARILFHKKGGPVMPPTNLLFEFLSNFAAAFLVAFVISKMTVDRMTCVLATTAIGLVGWLSISVSEWIWYRYPCAAILGEGVDQVVGWALTGLLFSKLLKSA